MTEGLTKLDATGIWHRLVMGNSAFGPVALSAIIKNKEFYLAAY